MLEAIHVKMDRFIGWNKHVGGKNRENEKTLDSKC